MQINGFVTIIDNLNKCILYNNMTKREQFYFIIICRGYNFIRYVKGNTPPKAI